MKHVHIYILIIIVSFTGCIEPPSGPEDSPVQESYNGAYILCEGLWGLDNSSLSRYEFESKSVSQYVYKSANNGQKLGDLASDFVVHNDYALITVTTTRIIEKIELKSGKSLGRMLFADGRAPRKITVINDSLAAVTDLLNHLITFFNPGNLQIIKDSVFVGPAPEGIATAGEVLLVVNSGYGDYLADAPKAGTISVVSINTMQEIGNFYVGPNPIEILINKKYNKFYVSYNNLPSAADSIGGIVEFDLNNLTETARLRTNVRSMTLSNSGDSLLFISDSTVSYIDLRQNFKKHKLIVNQNPSDIWYALACSMGGNIWIGNAKNYQINGELLIYKQNSYDAPAEKHTVGINPNKIVFYNKK